MQPYYAAQVQENLAFYEATAQIIPVLFIALVVEVALFRPDRRDARLPWYRQLMYLASLTAGLGVFVAGEWITLRVLLDGEASANQRSAVQVALGLCAAYLVLPAFLREARNLGPVAETVAEILTLAVLAGAVALLVVA